MSNNTECETLDEYLAEVRRIADEHEALQDLSINVDSAANAYIMRQNEKGKKCGKKQAVEKILSKIGLGKFKTYLHGDITRKTAREFVLKHYKSK